MAKHLVGATTHVCSMVTCSMVICSIAICSDEGLLDELDDKDKVRCVECNVICAKVYASQCSLGQGCPYLLSVLYKGATTAQVVNGA